MANLEGEQWGGTCEYRDTTPEIARVEAWLELANDMNGPHYNADGSCAREAHFSCDVCGAHLCANHTRGVLSPVRTYCAREAHQRVMV